MSSLTSAWLALLTDVSVKSLLLAALAGAVLLVMRVRNTNVRHRVWTGLLVGMLFLPLVVPVTPRLPVPAWLLPAFPLNEAGEAAAVPIPDAAPVPSEMHNRGRAGVEATQVPPTRFAQRASLREQLAYEAGGGPLAEDTSTEAVGGDDFRRDAYQAALHQAALTQPRPAPESAMGLWTAALFAVYASVFVIFLFRLVAGILGTIRLASKARPVSLECLDVSPAEIGLLTGVAILESSAIRVPLTAGWLRPKILLPVQWRGWSKAKRRTVLAHELAHVGRGDYLVTLLAEWNRCLYWFHPLAWYLRRRLLRLAELSCDDAVIARTGDRTHYARHLLEIAGQLANRRGRLVKAAAIPMARTVNVETRITAILDPKRAPARRLGRLGALILVGVFVPAVLLAAALRPAGSRAGAAGETANDQRAPSAPQEKPARPKVVEVFPSDGATGVAPDSEIRVRFDRPMDPRKAQIEWEHGSEGGFRLRGPLRYLEEPHEFVLPLRLTPGCTHKLTVNPRFHSEQDDAGFASSDQVAAKTYSWSFATARLPTAPAASRPKVVAVDPPSDSEIRLLTPIKVRFDRLMDPTWYGLADCYPEEVFLDKPKLCHFVEYDPERFEFVLPLQMPANWNGQIRLVHFCGRDGIEAEPVMLKYRTMRQPIAASLQRRADQAGRSPELLALVERIRAARSKLTSVSEEVHLATIWGFVPAWLNRYDCRGATFKMQGQHRFVANVDQIMQIPFRVGSDGTKCWFRGRDELVSCPFDEVAEKNVLFCDPFGAGSGGEAAAVIRDMKLEYLGEVMFQGQRCHRIRSWDIKLQPLVGRVTGVRDWFLDAQTLLPVRIETDGVLLAEYRYTRINEPIPEEEFQPETGPGIQLKEPEPLHEGYTRRFLNVMDGTGGRMSVRWGRKGPRGTYSSGLN